MKRLTFYDGLLVTKAHMEEADDGRENAIDAVAVDLGVFGVVDGMTLSQNDPAPDLSVLIQPGHVRDNAGQRITLVGEANLRLDIDSLSIPTAVSNVANEKWLGIFVKYTKRLTDPRQDNQNLQVWFRRDDYFEFKVVQGGEALIGSATKDRKSVV